MKFPCRLCIAIFAVASSLPAARAEEPSVGSLVMIGGGLRSSSREVWHTIVELARQDRSAGEKPRIAVFPTASAFPARSGERAQESLERAGAEAFVVPLAVVGGDRDYRDVAKDEAIIREVESASGVFFCGGNQDRITQALYDDEGGETALLVAIRSIYERGGVISGTSAGAAIMSRVMFLGVKSVLAALQNGTTMGREIGPGLGFLEPEWFVDQHFLVRGRFARALVAMQTQGIHYGLGIDEDTAVVVRGGEEAEVIGYRGVMVLDLSSSERDNSQEMFNIKNARLTYLDRGDMINLRTRKITPSEVKQDHLIDPKSPEFRPASDRTLFVNDVLGNDTVADLLEKLIENRNAEAIGLAFDGNAAQTGPTQGFEFRFRRGDDTVGWAAEGASSDYGYTVENVYLDVRPVEISGPLYK